MTLHPSPARLSFDEMCAATTVDGLGIYPHRIYVEDVGCVTLTLNSLLQHTPTRFALQRVTTRYILETVRPTLWSVSN